MALTILSRDEMKKAIVRDTDDGPVITYYRICGGMHGSSWQFERECCPRLPFHAALDLAVQMLNHRPPEIGGRL